jgi:hypothetical protein
VLSLDGEWRDELAGELDGAQAAVVIERAYKLDGGALGLQ